LSEVEISIEQKEITEELEELQNKLMKKYF
jgi:hypothetical protein